MIGKVIYNLLSNSAPVAAIVGTNIFPGIADEDIKVDYIVYEQSGTAPTNDKDGPSCLDVLEYDIEMYGKTRARVTDLADKVRTALDRVSGTIEGQNVDSIVFADEGGGYADADRVHIKIQRYTIRLLR